jgi:hypothetical protein
MCWPVKFDANYERKQYERQTLQRRPSTKLSTFADNTAMCLFVFVTFSLSQQKTMGHAGSGVRSDDVTTRVDPEGNAS